MLPFYFVFGSVLFLTVLSGAGALALAALHRPNDPLRRRTADRLMQVALAGAVAILGWLYAWFPS
jgi:hypothetical protein